MSLEMSKLIATILITVPNVRLPVIDGVPCSYIAKFL